MIAHLRAGDRKSFSVPHRISLRDDAPSLPGLAVPNWDEWARESANRGWTAPRLPRMEEVEFPRLWRLPALRVAYR